MFDMPLVDVDPKLQSEASRLATFGECWPLRLPSEAELASMGFIKYGKRGIVCCYCGLTFQQVTPESVAYLLHYKGNPRCKFLQDYKTHRDPDTYLNMEPFLALEMPDNGYVSCIKEAARHIQQRKIFHNEDLLSPESREKLQTYWSELIRSHAKRQRPQNNSLHITCDCDLGYGPMNVDDQER
jgi:hypothetical protein